jgi:hypothetical protein
MLVALWHFVGSDVRELVMSTREVDLSELEGLWSSVFVVVVSG